jgi:hypothetical protein
VTGDSGAARSAPERAELRRLRSSRSSVIARAWSSTSMNASASARSSSSRRRSATRAARRPRPFRASCRGQPRGRPSRRPAAWDQRALRSAVATRGSRRRTSRRRVSRSDSPKDSHPASVATSRSSGRWPRGVRCRSRGFHQRADAPARSPATARGRGSISRSTSGPRRRNHGKRWQRPRTPNVPTAESPASRRGFRVSGVGPRAGMPGRAHRLLEWQTSWPSAATA